MRNARTITLPPTEARELSEIVIKTLHLHGQLIEITTCLVILGEDGQIASQESEPKNFQFTGEEYLECLSANPEWAPNKPEGLFRDLDLLAFIDVLKTRPKKEVVTENSLFQEFLAERAQKESANKIISASEE